MDFTEEVNGDGTGMKNNVEVKDEHDISTVGRQPDSDESGHAQAEDGQKIAGRSTELADYESFTDEELVNELGKLIDMGDISTLRVPIATIKQTFRQRVEERNKESLERVLEQNDSDKRETPAPEATPLELKFNGYITVYKEQRAKYLEEQEQQKTDNLSKKQALLEELKELIASEETLKKTYDDFREIQVKWKDIGAVPRNENNNLWQSYHFLVEKFLDKVKINKELKDLDLKKNLEAKTTLCESTEELLLEKSVTKTFKTLQKYHEEWKEIGPAPADLGDELWERFKAASDQINRKRQDYYKNLKESKELNLEAKIALCEQAEEMVNAAYPSAKEYSEATEKVQELQKAWKSVGFASKNENNQVWERFRAAIDLFFTHKKEFFGQVYDSQIQNYNLKLELCTQAEALKDSKDWSKTTRELIDLQKQWKAIGPVPQKHSNKIWKRFRSACDEFFTNKETFFGNIGEVEAENLQKKEAIIKKAETLTFGDDKKENLQKLKDIQREWMEVTHVPAKEKERIQKKFRVVIDNHFNTLKLSGEERNTMGFKTKFESISETPGSAQTIAREIAYLRGKIKSQEGDIHLWENNLGFLAKSAKADALKQGFEKRIQEARDELKTMQEKLKYLHSLGK